jgi:hypothetical protein
MMRHKKIQWICIVSTIAFLALILFSLLRLAFGSYGQITDDAIGCWRLDDNSDPERTAVCFKWNETTRVWTEQTAGTKTTEWTFTESAGTYIVVWSGWDEENRHLPTGWLTIT